MRLCFCKIYNMNGDRYEEIRANKSGKGKYLDSNRVVNMKLMLFPLPAIEEVLKTCHDYVLQLCMLASCL